MIRPSSGTLRTHPSTDVALVLGLLRALVQGVVAASDARLVGSFGVVLVATSPTSCATAELPASATQQLSPPSGPSDPLPSWNDTPAKAGIIQFVRAVADPESPRYVEPEKRIATFDNDGTLWVERPLNPELAFAVHRIETLARAHPEWKPVDLLRTLLTNDPQSMIALGSSVPIGVLVASHTGMSTSLFETLVRQWMRDARHPSFQRPYTDLAYRPQLELLRFLRANDFTTYVLCAGTVEFMRPWAEETYGIRRDQVIGTSVRTVYEVQGGEASLRRSPWINTVTDGVGKPIAIQEHVGRRPILAFGNSDRDFEMLQWTTLGSRGTRLGLILHHDDAEREYAYDRDSSIGRLDRALDVADEAGWVVVSMKNDWKRVFAD